MARSKLTKKTVHRVAKLAELSLSPKEVTKLQSELSQIFEFVSRLDEVDTKNTPPLLQASNLEGVFREDKPTQSLPRKEALKNTTKTKNYYVKARKIF